MLNSSSLKAGYFFSLCVCVMLTFSSPALAKQSAQVWEKWNTSNQDNKEFIVHDPWDFFLKRFVIVDPHSGVNAIDFASIGEKERAEITAYIKGLEAIKISTYSKAEQLPYWINLYNALMVRVIAEHPEAKNVNDIDFSNSLLKKSGPWDEKLAMIEGEGVSLNDIYHRILRPIWKDNEIHYALYSGSVGSPNLQYDAYTSENITFLLYRGASHFINHPRAAWVDKDGKLTVSSLYEDNKEDFGGNDAGIIAHLKKYADEGLKEKLDTVNSVDKYSFDESLNAWIQKKEAKKN